MDNPARGDAANRFLASMTIAFDMWHDGEGYDLGALAEIPPAERPMVEDILIRHQPRDWRDIEALAGFDSPAARAAVVAARPPRSHRAARGHAPCRGAGGSGETGNAADFGAAE